MNELSNTIDLPSTLLRAQALFRRFQRTVDAIDKKKNFPAPSVRQRKPATPTSPDTSVTQNPSAKAQQSAASGTGADARTANGARPGSSEDEAAAKAKVISPELRGLLSRKVEILDKKQITEHGGGV